MTVEVNLWYVLWMIIAIPYIGVMFFAYSFFSYQSAFGPRSWFSRTVLPMILAIFWPIIVIWMWAQDKFEDYHGR